MNSSFSGAGRATRHETWQAYQRAVLVPLLVGGAAIGGIFLGRHTARSSVALTAPVQVSVPVPQVSLGVLEEFAAAIEKGDAICGKGVVPFDLTMERTPEGGMKVGFDCRRPTPIGKMRLPSAPPAAAVLAKE